MLGPSVEHHASRHPQVQSERRAVVGLHPEELAAPVRRHEAMPGQSGIELTGLMRTAYVGVAVIHVSDRAPERLLQDQPRAFGLGQLGHALILRTLRFSVHREPCDCAHPRALDRPARHRVGTHSSHFLHKRDLFRHIPRPHHASHGTNRSKAARGTPDVGVVEGQRAAATRRGRIRGRVRSLPLARSQDSRRH